MNLGEIKHPNVALKSIIRCLCIISPLYLFAQNIEFSASCDKTVVALGESFTLTLTVSGDVASVPKPELPDLKGFEVYSSGKSQSFSIINGKVSSSITYNYEMVPGKLGKFTIPPCKLRYKGDILQTESIDIEVVKSPTPSSAQKSTPPKQEEKLPPVHGGKDLFATASLSKKKAYVGEQIVYTFRFFQGVQLASAPQYTPPDFSGFWAEKLGEDRGYRTVEGKQYNVYEIRYALFPIAAGEYTIPSISITCQVEDLFSNPFSFSFGGKKKVVQTNPLHITVIPLPEGNKPASFTGGVGNFNVTSKIDKHKTNQNEPVVLYFTISGAGNLKSIGKPLLNIPENIKVYEPNSRVEREKTSSEFRGSKTFEIMLVPETVGEFNIPAIEFSYFDSSVQKYITKSTKPITITVEPGKTPGEAVNRGLAVREEIKRTGKDIRFIKTNFIPRSEKPPLYENKFFLFIHLLPVLFFLVLVKVKTGKERLSRDIGYARAKAAPSKVRRGLKRCEGLKDSPKEFYSLLSWTITNYIGDRLNIPAPRLTKDIISRALREKGIDDSIIKDFIGLLEQCELAQFGLSSFGVETAERDLDKAREVLRRLSKIKLSQSKH